MTQLTDRIAALETKLKNLKSRQLKDDSRKRTLESRRTRKADTRRKILIGAIVLSRIEKGRLSRAELITWLDQSLIRADDRALFDLLQDVGKGPTTLQSVASANKAEQQGAFQLTPAKSGGD